MILIFARVALTRNHLGLNLLCPILPYPFLLSLILNLQLQPLRSQMWELDIA